MRDWYEKDTGLIVGNVVEWDSCMMFGWENAIWELSFQICLEISTPSVLTYKGLKFVLSQTIKFNQIYAKEY